jgi:hypothetical protein
VAVVCCDPCESRASDGDAGGGQFVWGMGAAGAAGRGAGPLNRNNTNGNGQASTVFGQQPSCGVEPVLFRSLLIRSTGVQQLYPPDDPRDSTRSPLCMDGLKCQVISAKYI